MSKEKPLELALEDEDARGKPRLAANAYDPYNVDPSGGASKKGGARTDLRKLSQWIKLKREVDELKAAETAPGKAQGRRTK